jgi:hypothetical protein
MHRIAAGSIKFALSAVEHVSLFEPFAKLRTFAIAERVTQDDGRRSLVSFGPTPKLPGQFALKIEAKIFWHLPQDFSRLDLLTPQTAVAGQLVLRPGVSSPAARRAPARVGAVMPPTSMSGRGTLTLLGSQPSRSMASPNVGLTQVNSNQTGGAGGELRPLSELSARPFSDHDKRCPGGGVGVTATRSNQAQHRTAQGLGAADPTVGLDLVERLGD